MKLRSIFHKPVDRPIEGVIKADDDASLRLEMEEYVLTNEVEKRLESFLDAYNNYEGANGVWVSGFFGSGKSHLLKMLALLLENRQIDGAAALDLFLPKCGENEILRGDLKRAVAIPSKSILFNIDQKADVISKTQIDALLSVFVKVFDEMSGYYGKQGHIAQFERDMDSRGCYGQFMAAYEEIAGRSWQTGREQALLEAKNIASAYAQATGGDEASAIGILDKYRSQYRVSIEDFADQVLAYIESQPAGFRLNFCVDEVGQYIAENIKLMTNLQTIAESLATRCRGRAWVIVTAQEDMGMVVGEMGKQQGNDFSKIQARFANRMKLTSADVAEVIQKRLLLKNDEGIRLLTGIYHAQSNNFKTLFDFADGSQSFRNFQDRDHFIHSYPFIPYQFSLFQSAIQNLSMHNAFEGKHSSVGERSMLGVFQQVAVQIGDHRIGQLATFDLMFEGIRSTLKSQIQRAVIQAEHHLDNPFAIRLLKSLFLVKYVKEFKATVRNLCVLMNEGFDEDQAELRKRVEEALNLLEQQTYIQRNGELYGYLTDEEKDVEEEIKNTDIESTDVAAELDAIVFDQIIKQKKIRYLNGQDYPFSRRLDDRLHGREYELVIHLISPFHVHAENESIVLFQGVGRSELMILLPNDDRMMRDLLMYKKTEKYIRQNVSITQQDGIKRILDEKGFQNRERHADLIQRVKGLIAGARLFVAGREVEVASQDAQNRVSMAFQELVTCVYPNLRMLREKPYSESDIVSCLKRSDQGLFGTSDLAESEQEMFAFIQGNKREFTRTSVKALLEKFERKPYGWSFPAVLSILACLCARSKVEVVADSNPLEDSQLERALRNSHGHGNLLLEPQIEFTAAQVRALKTFYGDFFDKPAKANEARALGKETGEAIQTRIHELDKLASKLSLYSFHDVLRPVLNRLSELKGKPYTWYLTELVRQEDDLMEMKEGIIEPLRKFMTGPQRDIYDHAASFLQKQEPNFDYIDGDEHIEIHAALRDPECFKGNRMQAVKSKVDSLQAKITVQIDQEVTIATEKCNELKARLCGMDDFTALSTEQQNQINRVFDQFNGTIHQQKLIAVIRDTLRRFEDNEYPAQLARMDTWAQPTPPPPVITPKPGDDPHQVAESAATAPPPVSTKKPVEYVSLRAMPVTYGKAWLSDEAEVDRYLELMREVMLVEIHKGKKIQV